MNKTSFIVYFLCSFVYSQIMPTEMVSKVNIEGIPKEIPIISTADANISFHDYSVKDNRENGIFSYLKIHSHYDGNYQIKITQALIPDEGYFAFLIKIKILFMVHTLV